MKATEIIAGIHAKKLPASMLVEARLKIVNRINKLKRQIAKHKYTGWRADRKSQVLNYNEALLKGV